jgi:hypothetical protein
MAERLDTPEVQLMLPGSLLWLPLLALLPAEPSKSDEKPDRAALVKSARTVVSAILDAARENGKKPKPLTGDALTEYYVRAAATAARKLPRKQSVPAFLLAVGVALDTAPLLRNNPVSGPVWKRVESDSERTERLKVLGRPEVHARHDLAQHFSVSAALTAILDAKKAESIGVLKELLDAEPGGSGFSFADLAADLSGIAFAQRLLADPSRLKGLAGFTVADFALSPKGLTEGLTREQFEKQFGSPRDKRYRKAVADLKKKIQLLPGYK